MTRRIVLADDSQTIRKVVELVLVPEGFEIDAYRDGEEALKAISERKPAIVLADAELPKMSGLLLCSSMKNDPALANIPVILLVGAFQPLSDEAARASGADDLIVKPFDSKELVSKVKALVGSSRPAVASAPVNEPPVPKQTTSAKEEAELDDELARQWAAALEEKPAGKAQAGTVGALPELQSHESVSRDEMRSAATVGNVPKTVPPSIESQVSPRSTGIPPERGLLDGLLDEHSAAAFPAEPVNMPSREEIKSYVREAVAEAVAELLQSERTKIRQEMESELRRTVRDIAKAILERELERSMPE
ncbi:MAG TPA: response regulator [Dissulfurispiraceae bacterium]|nr:response regulator [Dissulfurispiraceae bacterium]